MKAYLEIRSKHSRGGSSHGWGGPDMYVSVQLVPDGVESLKTLNHEHAKSRGIFLKYFGEGYSEHRGPRSMLGQTIAKAERYVRDFNR